MGIKNYIYTYFKTNWLIFFAIIFIFLAGIAVGGYSLIMMNAENITSIKDYTDNFFSATVLNGTDNKSIFLFSFIDSFKIITLIWISGFFVFLIPVAFIQIFLKGFRIGFSIAYFSGLYSLKGLLYAFINYFSTNIFLLPLIIFFTVFCIKNSVKKGQGAKKRIFSLSNISVYIVFVALSFVLSLFDGYVMSFVLKLAAAINL